MTDTTNLDFSELLDRFIDGELSTEERQALFARAAEDPALGVELTSALEVQTALANLPAHTAPASLQTKLKAIPGRECSRLADWLLRPQWAVAAVLLLMLAGGGELYQQHLLQEQQQAELAQAKHDLALVLGYLEKINRSANHQIQSTVSEVTSEPVVNITTRTLQTQLQTEQEFEL